MKLSSCLGQVCNCPFVWFSGFEVLGDLGGANQPMHSEDSALNLFYTSFLQSGKVNALYTATPLSLQSNP